MKYFTQLFQQLDETNKTNARVEALADYFREAADDDKVWAIALMSHRRPKRAVNTTLLREWATEVSGIPAWLFEETYHVVGDLAETIAKILPEPEHRQEHSLTEIIRQLIEIRDKSEDEKKTFIINAWGSMDSHERFVFNKILTGGFRVGVSQKLMTRALGKATGVDENLLAHRLMGNWDPATVSFHELVFEKSDADDLSRPYPFYLAYPLEQELTDLGDPSGWSAERKWDGIRGQIILRKGELFVWSRGEELVTEKYPEFEVFKSLLPDGTVMDGEIMAWEKENPMSFQALQKRIGRKTITKNRLAKTPVIFMAYDLMEFDGKDIREESFGKRREWLEGIFREIQETPALRLSPLVPFQSWLELVGEREKSRELHCEGLMIKRKDSPYGVGRKKGDWWKWKIDPYTIDAVLTFAMRGHGRRANLYTDYTFGLWDKGELVTFAKAYSGLTDKEFMEVDRFVRQNTIQRFGPVRQVKPELVFEIHFEAIANSSRHKSGIAVRFPRIHKRRKDKKIEEANTLDDLRGMV
jgi:DNA ligase-1